MCYLSETLAPKHPAHGCGPSGSVWRTSLPKKGRSELHPEPVNALAERAAGGKWNETVLYSLVENGNIDVGPLAFDSDGNI